MCDLFEDWSEEDDPRPATTLSPGLTPRSGEVKAATRPRKPPRVETAIQRSDAANQQKAAILLTTTPPPPAVRRARTSPGKPTSGRTPPPPARTPPPVMTPPAAAQHLGKSRGLPPDHADLRGCPTTKTPGPAPSSRRNPPAVATGRSLTRNRAHHPALRRPCRRMEDGSTVLTAGASFGRAACARTPPPPPPQNKRVK